MNNEIQIRPEPGALTEFGSSKFGTMLELANRLSGSKLVPQQFRGAPEDIYLALDMAERMNMNPLLVMQNLYVVQGRPAWSSQFIIACVNASRRYTPLRFKIERDKSGNILSCQCVANDRATGEQLTGTKITAEMVRSEGWETKAGSKWKTMPEQMYRYRAAAFFARVNCPEVTMGIYTADEVREFAPDDTAAVVWADDPQMSPTGEQLPETGQGNSGRRASRPEPVVTIRPSYEPDEKAQAYADALRESASREELHRVLTAIGLDDKLTEADKNFLRPIAAAQTKKLSD